MGMNTDHFEIFEQIRDVAKKDTEFFAIYADYAMSAGVLVSHYEDSPNPLLAVLESEEWKSLGEQAHSLPAYLGAVAGVYSHFYTRSFHERIPS